MNNKVAIVGTVGIPACYGGFESLVENLTKYKSEMIQYHVFCSNSSYSKKYTKYNDAELIYLPLKANGWQSIPYDILSLIKCIRMKPDSILILGVSGCMFLPIFKLFSSSKIITNIDGLEWKREKWHWLIKRFLKASEYLAVKFSDVVITDNKAIGDYVDSEYGKDNVTIAYGGDHALRNIEVKASEKSYALGLCRIEPENNVHMILEAFSQTDRQLKFIGNWNASQFGRELKEKYSACTNIELLDPIYDLDELYRIRKSCNVYLHGHSAGGTNPSLVEMMHFGVPILAYDCNFNRYSTDDKAEYFNSSPQLIDLLTSNNIESLHENGLSMKRIAQQRYTWVEITRLYELTY
ncbi:DUF1972 domain-containing protein [Vibrio crassostreae]|uniref:WcvF n=1 Tax=Vibrio crassostreae TaxID=246167 RepID=A0ABP1WNP4_9VIBR|nr:DUF1972 domain-containing protein [Vibrio crassostreae]TCL27637.1 glycosyltransferase involved in cell wall biosynthesis [Vibrio crassostreae]TCT49012.1 glycosyltransferase involved in cell wall biosynthesis [Vibrio crassostreae]TCT58564.1 glycosyltransferase involved in cell wall biosynthesis [Vibrio crassostreae]CAK1710297.1 rhamnosyltransferase [Vibrio crassostreae]CAK1712191.1 rhamnosyltransferase [Vibrio crassostreae]